MRLEVPDRLIVRRHHFTAFALSQGGIEAIAESSAVPRGDDANPPEERLAGVEQRRLVKMSSSRSRASPTAINLCRSVLVKALAISPGKWESNQLVDLSPAVVAQLEGLDLEWIWSELALMELMRSPGGVL
jgi:hypothetical protein